MSWSIWLEADLGGPEPAEVWDRGLSPTYNLAPMLAEAGLQIRGLDGIQAATAAEPLGMVIQRLEADPERFKALNPSNGWGDYDGLLHKVLKPLFEACVMYPKAIVRVT